MSRARAAGGRGVDDCGRVRRERPEAGQACDERKQRVAGEADHRTLQDGHIKIALLRVTHAPRGGYSPRHRYNASPSPRRGLARKCDGLKVLGWAIASPGALL